MSAGAIRTIAVVGDGIAGWTAAAAIVRRVPNVAVAVVPVAALRPSFADMFGGTPPSATDFHADVGLDEAQIIARTGACYRLGTRFTGWSASPFSHVYGSAGTPIGPTPFAVAWAASRRAGTAAPYDAYSPAALLGAAGRFVPAGAMGEALLSGYGHGLQLDPIPYRRYVEGYARHLGVRVTATSLREAIPGAKGIAGLVLDDGSRLAADLLVDATNGDRRLIDAVAPGGWADWSEWLPCDSVVRAASAPSDALPSVDDCTAIDGGWHLRSALPGRTDHALVYSQDAIGDRRAARLVRGAAGTDPAAPIRFRNGRRHRAWVGNVVAVGEAAVILEPLEAMPMHVLHSQVDRLISLLPDRDFAEVELDHYNRESGEEADRLRDFLTLHYAINSRNESFWKAASRMTPPPLLAATFALFRERGRLPVRDREGFTRDSWLALLFGHDILPRRGDALMATIDPAQASRMMEQYCRRLVTLVAAAPPHRTYVDSIVRERAA